MRYVALQGISGSGKTTLAMKLSQDNPRIHHIGLDSYYKEGEEIMKVANKEDISALDLESLRKDMEQLETNHVFTIKKYDFVNKRRIAGDTIPIENDAIILIEGIHAFEVEDYLQHNFERKIFLDIDICTCILRRMRRDLDTSHPENKVKPLPQYLDYMEQYVIPQSYKIQRIGRGQADEIIYEGGSINL